MTSELIEDIYPLSPMQQGLLFHSLYSAGSGVYVQQMSCTLQGDLDVPAFERAWQRLVDRHAILRTAFVWEDLEEPVQVVHRRVAVPLERKDWRALSAADQEARLADLLDEDRRRGFELSHAPLMRLVLIDLGGDAHQFVWSHHHVLMDGWCNTLLQKEFLAHYEAFAAGRDLHLPPPRPYRDYIAWLRRRDLSTAEGFWRRALRGFTTPTRLSVDRRSDGPLEGYARQQVELSAEASDALRSFARQHQLTLNSIAQGAWGLLLSRYSGDDDVVFGTVVSGRPPEVEGIETMVGLFIGTVPVRIRVAGEDQVLAWLKRMQEQQVELREYESSPLVQVQGWSDVPRGVPLFETLLAYENYPLDAGGDAQVGGLRVGRGQFIEQVSYPLSLVVLPHERLMLRCFSYRSRFADATITRLLHHYRTLLEEMVGDPRRRLRDLRLLTAAERRQLLVGWSAARADRPSRDRCIHELFEAQAERTPEAVAVVYEGEALSYRELNRRANQLAHHLRRLGVGPEVAVGICMERSLELVIGLLGILKAGGAYVPLDPRYPPSRLAAMVDDARMAVVVSQEGLVERLEVGAGTRVVSVDGEREAIAGEREENPDSGVTGEHLAYVIYTSGSTGKPKGVLISHANVARLFDETRAWFGFDEADVWTLFHSHAFDFSVWELWGALRYGGRLVVVPYGVSRSPERFLELLRKERVTVLNQTPSAFRQLMEVEGREEPGEPLALRLVIFGGEALDLSSLKGWFARHGDERPCLVNMYGITETTVHVTYRPLTRHDPTEAPGSVIGRPIPDLEVYILDEALEPVPIGVAGQLYVGGRGVGRGYLGRPELTAERFIPDPFGHDVGSRLYKTGDLGRYLEDGDIEYLGRIDHQVKVRGFRIELGEIESVIAQSPLVRESVVVMRADPDGDRRLVAYVVPDRTAASPAIGSHPEELVGEVRRLVKEKLPEYMVPSAFVVLEAVPLDPNGKVDRRALPPPDPAAREVDTAFVAPRTELERCLATVWQDTLHVDQIGVHDNFFEAGGDSIKSVVVINKLQARLGQAIQPVVLFDAPTIAELAGFLQRDYSEAVARVFGVESLTAAEPGADDAALGVTDRIDAPTVMQVRRVLAHLAPRRDDDLVHKAPNRSALFILAPPRSGTTLLRVLLAGHPGLFAPPELELLAFNTLRERAAAFSERNRYALEGTLRAIMEIKGCDAEGSRRIMDECVDGNMSVKDFYHLLQGWLEERLLVDKTPSYTLDLEVLRRAELDFGDALYIHLLRHPCGMIRSFEEVRLDQVFVGYRHSLSRRALAELIWVVSQMNIIEFLKTVPAARQRVVRFEDLVREPGRSVEGICRFLGLDYRPEMIRPYEDRRGRMTDGIHPLSRMLGDIRFLEHTSIDPGVADRWREDGQAEARLAAITWQVAQTLGYETPRAADASGLDGSPGIGAPLPPLLPVPRDAELPLSFAEQRLWFLDQLVPGNPFYNMPFAFRIMGAVDVGTLRRSVNEIVRRHEVLRTTFPSAGGRPVRAVSPSLVVDLPEVDLRTLPDDEREAQAERLIAEEARRSFDLAAGPLLRGTVLRMGGSEYIAMLTTHHIIADGWSLDVFLRESVLSYMSFVQGKPSSLPDLSIQYADFAHWQRRWLTGDVLEQQLDYWRKRLADLSTLRLPTDRPRPPQQTYRGAKHYFTLPTELARGLKGLSERQGATLYMTLLAAFQVFLHRYSRQDDICVGSPTANRNRAELEGLIGFFVNMLVMRADLGGNPTFLEHLGRVREAARGAFAHQDVPFEQLVEVLQPERDLSREPVFQVAFALQNAPRTVLRFPDLTVTRLDADSATSKYDLILLTWEADRGLGGAFVYSTDLFDGATIVRMAEHFRALLEGIVRDPRQRISDLPMMMADERRRLLEEWSKAPSAGAPRPDVDATGSIADLDRLSEDELDSLIEDLTAEGGT